MVLKIPKDQAIKILNDRLNDIDAYGFNPKAWKERTALDLKEIFPLGSSQWIEIKYLNFDTFVTSEKQKVLNEGKETAKRMIASYIAFINDHSKIAEEKKVIVENDYQQKYTSLLKEWNELVPGYNDLIKRHEEQIDTNEGLLQAIETRDEEIERIKSETIQLDNVSLKKVWVALINLPLGKLIAVFSVMVGLIVGSFTLGTLYERTSANNELFDLRNTNKELQDQHTHDKASYDSLKSKLPKKTDTTHTSVSNISKDTTHSKK